MCSLSTEKIRLRRAIALPCGCPRTRGPRGASRRSSGRPGGGRLRTGAMVVPVAGGGVDVRGGHGDSCSSRSWDAVRARRRSGRRRPRRGRCVSGSAPGGRAAGGRGRRRSGAAGRGRPGRRSGRRRSARPGAGRPPRRPAALPSRSRKTATCSPVDGEGAALAGRDLVDRAEPVTGAGLDRAVTTHLPAALGPVRPAPAAAPPAAARCGTGPGVTGFRPSWSTGRRSVSACSCTAASSRSAIPSLSSTTTARIVLEPDPRHERVRALQPLGVLPVVLQEAPGEQLGRLGVVDGAEQVALADVRAGGAADVDLPAAALDGHDADVLDVGLGAVAGAAGDGELHLGRALHALQPGLDLDAQLGGVAGAEPAELLPDAGLHGAEATCRTRSPTACRGRPRPSAGPPCWMPSRSIRWPPVSLTIGTSYFSATSAIRRSCSGVVTPPLICGTTEKVPSFWMLACTRSLMNRASLSSTYVLAPHHLQQRGQAHLGLRVLGALRGQRGEHRRRPSAGRCSRIAAISAGLSIGMPGT